MTSPPDLSELAADLLIINENLDEPWTVCLAFGLMQNDNTGEQSEGFYLAGVDDVDAQERFGREVLPGAGKAFDATAAARRLLADLSTV